MEGEGIPTLLLLLLLLLPFPLPLYPVKGLGEAATELVLVNREGVAEEVLLKPERGK